MMPATVVLPILQPPPVSADELEMDVRTATTEDHEGARHPPSPTTRAGPSARVRIWGLTAAIWLLAVPVGRSLIATPPASGLDHGISWWWLATGFLLAEILVVHLQFRGDAHTLSISEVPLVVGLLLATPAELVTAQLIGSAVALGFHRRQRPVKLAFNLGQLVLQLAAGVALFRLVTGGGVGFELRTLFGLMVAAVGALFVGHIAVAAAIWVTAGRESPRETARVFLISSAGAVAATVLGMMAALAVVAAPRLWWLGLAPVVLVFVAYRAYISQAQDRDRVEALFDAATVLHRTPQIDGAVDAVVRSVLDLVKAEMAAVVLFAARDDPAAYLTVVDAVGPHQTMTSCHVGSGVTSLAYDASPARRILAGADALPLTELLGGVTVRQAVVDVLSVGGHPVGLLMGVNRAGDVSTFGEADLRVLATLGSQLSTTLENSRLTETLDELRSLKEQLEALIESKDRLVASVSHELRTPLTAVIGLTAVIRDGVDDRFDPETLGMLDMIVEQGNELSNIIEDLLTHARAEAGTLTIRPESFDVTRELEIVAGGYEIQVEDLLPVWAFADPLRVRQIIRNLLSNARRYGGAAVKVVVEQRFDRISVAVVDNGSGVDPSEEALIFEPYHSAHDHLGQPGSVGLGLAVSRSMAHMMGCELTYERRHGQTWFRLEMPAIPAPTHR